MLLVKQMISTFLKYVQRYTFISEKHKKQSIIWIFLEFSIKKFCGLKKMTYLCSRNSEIICLLTYWDMV